MAKIEQRHSRREADGKLRSLFGRRTALFILGLSWLVCWGAGQTLVEAAKMEKARRARFRGNSTATITNKDLPRSTCSITGSDVSGGESGASITSYYVPSDLQAPSKTVPAHDASVRSESQGPVYALRQDDLTSHDAERIQKEGVWQQAKDQADNLEIRIGEYWQDYYASRDQASRLMLEKQIAQASEAYDRAREEESQAWAKADRLANRDERPRP